MTATQFSHCVDRAAAAGSGPAGPGREVHAPIEVCGLTKRFGRLAALRGRRDRARERELIERFDVDPAKRVRSYSTGNRQKIALIAALAAPTRLLVLDEPTRGLDPVMEQVFSQEVARAAGEGRTVLLSSHVLAEVQRLCSAVTIIKAGRVVESGDLSALRALSETRITAGGSPAAITELRERLERSGLPCRSEEAPGSSRLEVDVPAARVPEALAACAALRLTEVTCAPASLEELFLRHDNGAS